MHRTLSPLLLFSLNACTDWTPPEREATSGLTGITLTAASGGETTGWGFPGAPEIGQVPPLPGTTSGMEASGSSAGPGEVESGEPMVGVDLAALQISELLPDPAGKDGGAASPEFVEILHVGGEPTTLAGLEIVARAWPVQSAADLGIADAELAPGQRLVVLRYAAAADLPHPPVVIDDAGISVAFVHEDGLRNADGGVLLRAGGVVGDLVIFGAAQPAPWDSPGAWNGAPAPAPGSGASLCRVVMEDHNEAGDFGVCAPSPGTAGEDMAEDSTSGTSTGGSMTTGGETTGSGSTGMEALPAEVAIVEVLSNPPGPGPGEKFDEFVELLNLGPGDVDLGDWKIADSIDDSAPGIDPLVHFGGDGGCAPATCLAAGQRAIIVGNTYTGPTGPGLVLAVDDTTLANAGLAVHEPVVVRDGDGEVRSTYRAWPDPLAAPDPVMTEEALVRDPEASDAPEAWSFAAPSPGT